jgi:hypothetical protein
MMLNTVCAKTVKSGLLPLLVFGGTACLDPSGEAMGPTSASTISAARATPEVTIDFSAVGAGNVMDPDFFKSDGIVFPPEFCGPSGCTPLNIVNIQGDAALSGDPRFGPITAKFSRPISGITPSVAPALQGTATYVLRLFSASGAQVGETVLTVTQDVGDSPPGTPGYFEMSATDLSKRAKSFTLENIFVRTLSGPPTQTLIPYGVNSITYTY